MAQETDLPQGTTGNTLDMLIDDMLQTFYTHGTNPEMDARVEKAVIERDGIFFPRRKVAGSALLGFPGQGKTSLYKAAAKECARLMGMRLRKNPSFEEMQKEPLSENDMLLVSRELSGEVHAGSLIGPPSIEEFKDSKGNVTKFSSSKPPLRLAALSHAGASVLLLDDALNAAPHILNVCLSLTDEKRYESLDIGENTYVGMTGNLGALDGTHTSKMSSALRTRVKLFQIEDTVENWIERTQAEYTGEVADGGISAFLAENKDLFHVPSPRGHSSYPTSRTWSNLAPDAEEVAHQIANGVKDPQRSLDRLHQAAQGVVGLEAAKRLKGFMYSLHTKASPLARESIDNNGKFSEASEKEFKARIGDGFSTDGQEFGHQFVTSAAEYAAVRVKEANDRGDEAAVAKEYERFGNTLLNHRELTNDLVSRGFGHLLVRLNAVAPEIATKDSAHSRPVLTNEHLSLLSKTVAQSCPKSGRDAGNGQTMYRAVIVPQVSGTVMNTDDLMADVDDKLLNPSAAPAAR